jgi:hypothetical protein
VDIKKRKNIFPPKEIVSNIKVKEKEMKHLRQYIRNILFESSEELRKQLVQKLIDYNEYTAKEIKKNKNHDGYRSVKYLKDRDHKDVRRKAKIFWNANADHDFFETGLRKYHQLGYSRTFNPDHYFSKTASKNELSCFGGANTGNPLTDIMQRFSRMFDGLSLNWGSFQYKTFLEIDGRVTWAGDFDAYTEELSLADEEDKRRMKSSGLAKRPGHFVYAGKKYKLNGTIPIKTTFDYDLMVLDEEDFLARNRKSLDEIVVDNWKVKTYWIALSEDWLPFLRWDEKEKDLSIRKEFAGLMRKFPSSPKTTNKLKKIYDICIHCEKLGIPVSAVINFKAYDGIKIFKSWKMLSENE